MKLELDPAAALIAICARCTFDDHQRVDIRATLERGVDWPRALALAEKNYVLPLLFEGLEQVRDLVPEAVYERLSRQRKLLKLRVELFADELIRVSASLEAVGITVLHYKGPVSSELLYGDRFRRTYFDLDFLVRREDLHEVSRLLRSDGYTAEHDLDALSQEHFEREQKEYTFSSGLVCIEPHWSLTARRYPFPIDYARLWERAVVCDLGGTKVRTFAPDDMLLVLSMAGGKGKWKRLQMVTDVAQLYRSMDPDLAVSALAHARRLGCERILLVGAHLAQTLLEAPIPAAIDARIHADYRAVKSVSARVIRSLFSPPNLNVPLLGDSAHLFSPLLYGMRERARDRLAYLVQTTTTPLPEHLLRFGLPKWASPAYRVIVPVHDYVLAPIFRGLKAMGSSST
jgi:Uncharacterised nucleotidyltransferase